VDPARVEFYREREKVLLEDKYRELRRIPGQFTAKWARKPSRSSPPRRGDKLSEELREKNEEHVASRSG